MMKMYHLTISQKYSKKELHKLQIQLTQIVILIVIFSFLIKTNYIITIGIL
jgi:hypothetical protein